MKNFNVLAIFLLQSCGTEPNSTGSCMGKMALNGTLSADGYKVVDMIDDGTCMDFYKKNGYRNIDLLMGLSGHLPNLGHITNIKLNDQTCLKQDIVLNREPLAISLHCAPGGIAQESATKVLDLEMKFQMDIFVPTDIPPRVDVTFTTYQNQ